MKYLDQHVSLKEFCFFLLLFVSRSFNPLGDMTSLWGFFFFFFKHAAGIIARTAPLGKIVVIAPQIRAK
jgi:hypothetical protein